MRSPRRGSTPSSNALRFEFAAPAYLDESCHRVPVEARRPGRRVVGVDARAAARLHQPRVRRLPLPRAGAQRHRAGERGGGVRVRDPAAVVPHVVGLRAAYAARVGAGRSSPSIACSAGALVAKERERAQFAEARLRAEAAEALARVGKRGQAERRAAQRNRPRDHRLARLRHDLRQALRARQRAGRRRGVRRRPLPPRPQGDRVPARDREGQALRARTRATPRDPNQLPVWCIEHREPVFINDVDTESSKYIGAFEEQRRAARGRHDVGGAAVDHLHAAHRQGARARASSPSRASRRTRTPSIT